MRYLSGAVFSLLLLVSSLAHASVPLRHDACVILLHGLYRTQYSMKYLEWSLSELEYEVINLSYPSLWEFSEKVPFQLPVPNRINFHSISPS